MSFSCCAPLGEEARLLRDCYPPKKQLIPAPSLSSGVPDMDSYKPSSQELSKMTYYATNKRGKLNVLARELDERVRKEVRDAGNGYTRSRISLLISLAILKSLVTECKRDIPLFASYILRIVENSMTLAIKGGGVIKGAKSASVDLEIAVRAGAAFTAFVTFADGNALGADDSILSTYISVLKQFSTLSLNAETSSHLNDSSSGSGSGEAKQKDARDHETRNRTRLVGLAALAAAVHSELMFAGNSEFGSQVKVMVPALLENTWLGDSDTLQNEIARATIDTSPSPYFAEFSARPALANRRAPSLYAHIAGEKGPMTSDVIGAALGTLRDLVRQCYAQQTSQVIDVVIAWLDRGRWADVSRCSLLLEALTTFSNLRYRYAYPMALVEELLKFDQEEVSETHQRASSLITILTNLLSSEKLSMPGLSTTKLLHDLLSVIIRQSKAGDDISLLLSSIGSLCTHIYYGDQVNDLVEVIVNRIAAVQSAAPHLQLDGSLGPPARKTNSRASSFTSSAEQRDTVVNALIACTNAIMLTIPSKADPRVADGRVRRNAVSVEVWQETLPLLCDRSFAVRSEYAKTLLLYLRQEIPLLTDDSPPGTPQEWKTTTTSPLIRFLNALNATLYTLAISSRLGYSGPAIAPPTPHESPKPTSVHTNNNITDDRPVDSPVEDSPPHLSSSPRPVGIVGRRASKLVALPLHRSETFTAAPNTVYDQATAGPFDYTVIAEALEAVFGNAPIRALFCGVPMMLALDRETSAPGEIAAERRKACKEVLVRAWSIALQSVGESIDAVSLYATSPPVMLSRTPTPVATPSLPVSSGVAHSTFPPLTLAQVHEWSAPELVLDRATAMTAFSGQGAMASFGLDSEGMSALLSRPWTVHGALEASVEFYGDPHALPRRRGGSLQANVILERNSSLHSASPSTARFIDVTDLREALDGATRNVTDSRLRSTTDLEGNSRDISPRSASLRSFGDKGPGGPVRRLNPEDAKAILKDIFRDKRKAAAPQDLVA